MTECKDIKYKQTNDMFHFVGGPFERGHVALAAADLKNNVNKYKNIY